MIGTLQSLKDRLNRNHNDEAMCRGTDPSYNTIQFQSSTIYNYSQHKRKYNTHN